jgi:hypothetical protein
MSVLSGVARVARVARSRTLCGLAVGLAGALVFCLSCGSGVAGDTILTIDQALTVEKGQAVKVQGMLVAAGDEIQLASVLLESYPPQAGGSTLIVAGLDLATLVGLSSTVDQPDLEQVVWSGYPLVLEGVIKEGVLEVKNTPPVVEASTAEFRVRFSPASEPLMLGGGVWWVFEVTNLTRAAIDLTFPSGQMGEIVFSREGTEEYRWSAGKQFVQSVEVTTLQPGKSTGFVLGDTLALAPGVYDVTATVAASAGPEGSSKALPEIKTTSTVR